MSFTRHSKNLRDACRPGAWLADYFDTMVISARYPKYACRLRVILNTFYMEFGKACLPGWAASVAAGRTIAHVGDAWEFWAWWAYEQGRGEFVFAVANFAAFWHCSDPAGGALQPAVAAAAPEQAFEPGHPAEAKAARTEFGRPLSILDHDEVRNAIAYLGRQAANSRVRELRTLLEQWRAVG